MPKLCCAVNKIIIRGRRRLTFKAHEPLEVNSTDFAELLGLSYFYEYGHKETYLSKYGDPGTPSRQLVIGIHRRGGLGDALLCTAQVAGVRRLFPNAYIIGYFNGSFIDVFKHNRDLSELKVINPTRYHSEKLVRIRYMPFTDIWFDFKPCSRVFVQHYMVNVGNKLCDHFSYLSERYKDLDEGYIETSPKLLKFKKFQLELTKKFCNIDCSEDDMHLSLSSHDTGFAKKYGNYIVIHTQGWGGNQTKNWYHDRWCQLVKLVKEKYQCQIIHIGAREDKFIPRTLSLLGKTSFREAAALVKGSKALIGIEGVFGHVGSMYKVPTFIFYGPTPYQFWGHSNIIPIQSKKCSFCWWKHPRWHVKCMRTNDFENRICMKDISVEYAFKVISKVL